MGHVANFVETEQIVERGGERCSFVQTRGSIPLFWTQYPNLKYKPSMSLSPQDHVAAYTRHLRDQQQRYGSQVLVNLIDQRGKEEALEQGYRACVAAAALPGVRYEPFDFHAECRGMRYDRLRVLTDRIHHEQLVQYTRYEPFDFHAECRGMRYDRLRVLTDRIHHEQTEFGYFLSRGGTVLLRQSGVFRTNCVDCLDRTNVLQSELARRQLIA
ncbi:unnamed protein product [Plutella xylostella]|uniref:Phosphatidylinositol-3-phosphatase SAC1 n=1 Tax=Plutella xylostella TaxID=51655 RepID=A0A8S4GE36_PLUXY|nr:unnamed protein product [Plutella xylostella]